MNFLTLRIKLDTDVVLTERNASIGSPRTLDYIPGAALLGVAAESLYKELPTADAFGIFHSGAVRFGNGVPEADGLAALPMPLAFHRQKGVEDEVYLNMAKNNREPQKQYEQCREGWLLDRIDASGLSVPSVTPARSSSMRTSVDQHGQAREGLLFGIESLEAGQTFIARIDADDSTHLKLVEKALVGNAIRLGRSKTAEFGEVSISKVAAVVFAEGRLAQETAVFLCLSDLALRDSRTGSVRLAPAATDFGLPQKWELDLSHSFLRTRRYSPFNGHRRRPDQDRQVIKAGSVMVFRRRGDHEASHEEVNATLHRGVGDFRQDGLGQVRLEPSVLRLDRIKLATKPISEPAAAAPQDKLAGWLIDCARETTEWDMAWRLVDKTASDLQKFNLSNAQWGWIRTLAQAAHRQPNAAAWLQKQFEQATLPAPTLKERKLAEERKEPISKDGGGRALVWAARRQKESARSEMLNWMMNQPPADLAMRTEMLAARIVQRKAAERPR
ncbi:MAG: hypothetical protein HY646_06645 [Acidobacteria bacterium]|nr:hypothetical protein [Acidobacteriota bacterium]